MKNYRFLLDQQIYSKDIEVDINCDKGDIELVEPSDKFKHDILKYKSEFLLYGDDMDGTAGLQDTELVEDWLVANHLNKSKKTVEAGLVPSNLFLVIRRSDGQLIGMIHIRRELNEYLEQFGGHIGYSVRKTERRKGYATEMLKLGLAYSKYIGIEKVLLTCNKNNPASKKTIEKNGGILENEVLDGDGNLILRYWISL